MPHTPHTAEQRRGPADTAPNATTPLTTTACHPTGKPVALIEELISTFTNPGGIVLDPVIGGGATALAVANLEGHFIGIEKDEAYAALAQECLKHFTTSESEAA